MFCCNYFIQKFYSKITLVFYNGRVNLSQQQLSLEINRFWLTRKLLISFTPPSMWPEPACLESCSCHKSNKMNEIQINQLKINPIEARISWAIQLHSHSFRLIHCNPFSSLSFMARQSPNPTLSEVGAESQHRAVATHPISTIICNSKKKYKIKSVSNNTWAVSVSFVWMKEKPLKLN